MALGRHSSRSAIGRRMQSRSILSRLVGPRRRARLAHSLLGSLPAAARARAVERLLAQPVTVETPHGATRFLNHGRGSCKRAQALLTKEPDSLAWIDRMAPGSVFWDIGANIGVLTLYAALRGDLEVWAFEPAAVNYYNLAANCELNGLDGQVRCLQLGFGDSNEILDLHISQMMPARSFTFREKLLRKPKSGKPRSFPCHQPAQVWRIDDFIDHYRLSRPNYLKIDVPGLTPEILLGGRRTLSDAAVREVQVEAREQGPGGRRVLSLMSEAGFEISRRNKRLDGTPSGDLVFSRTARTQSDQLRAATSA